MLLKEHLNEYTKNLLLDWARCYGVKGFSTLNKAQLIDRIVEAFCSDEILRKRMSCLTNEQLELFRKGLNSQVYIEDDEIIYAVKLNMYWLGSFGTDSENLVLYDEVKDAFLRIDDEKFKEEQSKKNWLMKCIEYFNWYYGLAPLEIIYKLYQLKADSSMNEMIQLLSDIPADILGAGLYPMDAFGSETIDKSSVLYSDTGLLVSFDIMEDQELMYILESQDEKDFYIPDADEIEEICKEGYEKSSPVYIKLNKYFKNELGMSKNEATIWCLDIWNSYFIGESPADLLNDMVSDGIEITSDDKLDELLSLLIEVSNGTRVLENRGHKPAELFEQNERMNNLAVLNDSYKADSILKEADKHLKSMGISVDTTSVSSATISSPASDRKIYPNEPCPCGSGKKYKKCCGRK